MTKCEESQIESRMYTTHGKKKNMGKWYKMDNRPVLAFTTGEDEKVIGYTPIEDILKLAYAANLPVLDQGIEF